ncbi:hypothetical protein AWB76_06329 [Caballeronia temeraria]|uniref:Glycosyltransferase RgtA/B/C/D-like domain-containing protein n=1 Tax=Caballeronia temeraria TaxID=1777137 RepID=A0A158D1A1_9BURK|nr:hypothetical protein [Caballeronia temeraria]SAK88422.1 hypothetical protein AWB76_06329 [Caballeronia temeraria]
MKIERSGLAPAAESKRGHISEIMVCGVFLLVGGILSLKLGKDVNWDLLNYHLYNGWALLHRPWGVDLYPAQLQTFFNPVLDAIFFVIQHRLPDGITVFLLGLPVGATAYILWRIFPLLIADESAGAQAMIVKLVGIVLSVTGAAAIAQAGTTTNEWPVLVLVLGGLWALLSAYRSNRKTHALYAIAGLLFGGAVGLKLTAATQVVALTIALPWLLRNREGVIRALVCYVIGGIIGFALTDGFWMWMLYKNFHNPLFPFFNSLFNSPLLDNRSMIDNRFLPKSFFDAFIFPLVCAIYKNRLHNEGLMRDPRLLIGSTIALAWIALGVRKIWRPGASTDEARIRFFLATSFLLMYVLWVSIFGIYRYAILLEVLAVSMAYVLIVSQLKQGKRAEGLMAAIAVLCAIGLLTMPPQLARADVIDGPYFSSNLPKLPKDSLLLTLTPEPVAYLVPQFADHPRVVAPHSNLTGPDFNRELQRAMASAVDSHNGPVFAVTSAKGLDWAGSYLLDQYQLALDAASCRHVESDVDSPMLCATTRKTYTDTKGFDQTDPARNKKLIGAYLPEENPDAAWAGRAVFISFAKQALESGHDLEISGELPVELYRKKYADLSKAKLSIWVNGRLLRSETIHSTADREDFSYRLSAKEIADASNGYPVIGVEVRSPAFVVPSAIGMGADVRELGMRIRHISFAAR